MNLDKLFKLQKALDERITKEKGLEGQDLLPKKILALQTELGELANEWRGFKFWSNKQWPRLIAERGTYDTFGAPVIEQYNPLLEEYVDCLHFILSIGLEIHLQPSYFKPNTELDATTTFIACNSYSSDILVATLEENEGFKEEVYIDLITHFIGLGEMLGFTWEQIKKAYLEKNEINHSRQSEGY